MTKRMLTLTSTGALALVALLAGACRQSTASEEAPDPRTATAPVAAETAPNLAATSSVSVEPQEALAGTPVYGSSLAAGTAIAITGAREQTEQFIHYYQAIALSPEQERIKVEALSTIPAPCCSNNSLATCCCPCNMAKAAWGMAAFLITEYDYGVEEIRQAAVDWIAAANPDGFTGDACYSGGCKRPINQNGCGGMNARHVL